MRVPSLARRLGSAALVLTMGVGLAACSDDSGSTDSSSSATDESTEDATTTDDGADESEEPAEASLAELSADDFYPAVMDAMRGAETFAFETTSGSAGQTQTMTGAARFGDDGRAHPHGGTGEPDEAVLDAAASCPMEAIVIRDAETGEPVEP